MDSVLGSQGERKESIFCHSTTASTGCSGQTPGSPKKPLTAFLLDHHMGLQHKGFVEATGLAGSLEAPFPAE